MASIRIEIGHDGRIVGGTINEMFVACMGGTAEINDQHKNGFIVGIRLMERLATSVGLPLGEFLEGKTLLVSEDLAGRGENRLSWK